MSLKTLPIFILATYRMALNFLLRVTGNINSITFGLRHPTLLHSIEDPSVLPEETVYIATGEGQIPVYHSNQENWEPLAFPKLHSHG